MNIAQADVRQVPAPVTTAEPALILTPALTVHERTRSLWCDRCGMVKPHTEKQDKTGSWYVCDCGEKMMYLIVRKKVDEPHALPAR